jgi:hypothetical protein
LNADKPFGENMISSLPDDCVDRIVRHYKVRRIGRSRIQAGGSLPLAEGSSRLMPLRKR